MSPSLGCLPCSQSPSPCLFNSYHPISPPSIFTLMQFIMSVFPHAGFSRLTALTGGGPAGGGSVAPHRVPLSPQRSLRLAGAGGSLKAAVSTRAERTAVPRQGGGRYMGVGAERSAAPIA